MLPQPPTPQVLAFINGEVQREADSDAFEILHTPLVIRLADLHAAFLSDRIGIGRCLRLLAEVVALYTCDVLLLTGRPARFPGVQALLRHLQPLPASRILPLEGYHTRSWYPFNKRGRIDNPKSTAAVGAMLCLLAIDLRLESFTSTSAISSLTPPFATWACWTATTCWRTITSITATSIWIAPTSRSTPPAASSCAARCAWLPPTGQRTLAGLAALYADHQ